MQQRFDAFAIGFPHPDGPEFEVIDAEPRRIKRLRVRIGGSHAAE